MNRHSSYSAPRSERPSAPTVVRGAAATSATPIINVPGRQPDPVQPGMLHPSLYHPEPDHPFPGCLNAKD